MTTQTTSQINKECGNCNLFFPADMMYDDLTCLCCQCAGQDQVGAECICPDDEEFCGALGADAEGDECMRGMTNS